MKIREIKAAGLRGATPEGGWANEIKPEDCVHTLIAISTEAQGILTWAIPLGGFLAVLIWYVLLLRRRHPE